ncbi:HWE histidine kinase domain-containing protein [Roseomonas sp. CCTCC AB2023176]|uniref:HWE histidine kinase domain-containing protein n=1 Tax=Roseomonas sp. CCTCC AB2023176 TaxID=3342640 RepID=UPI0035E100C4
MTPASIRAQVFAEDWSAVTSPADRAAGRIQPSVEFRIHRADTGEERWLSRSGEIVRDASGQPLRLRGVVQDITDRKRAEEKQRLLMAELLHRVKNNLALVQALAAQTFRSAPTLDAARDAFGARLRALARAHDLLAEGRADTTLRDLLRGIIALHGAGGDHLVAEGPPVRLGSNAALALALALHELATNAAKYGALSVPGGRVAVTWTLEGAGPDRILRFRWVEAGGPPVTPPTRRGFGTRLIEDNLRRAWHGTTALRFAPEGLTLEAAAPVARLGT